MGCGCGGVATHGRLKKERRGVENRRNGGGNEMMEGEINREAGCGSVEIVGIEQW